MLSKHKENVHETQVLANRKLTYDRPESGDKLELPMIMLQTKYLINPTYKSFPKLMNV